MFLEEEVQLTRVIIACICFFLSASAVAAPGFFTVAQDQGVWWLKDGEGRKFYCKAVNSVGLETRPDKFDAANPGYCGLHFYPTGKDWARDTLKRLDAWGFNTVGGYSDREILDEGVLP